MQVAAGKAAKAVDRALIKFEKVKGKLNDEELKNELNVRAAPSAPLHTMARLLSRPLRSIPRRRSHRCDKR